MSERVGREGCDSRGGGGRAGVCRQICVSVLLEWNLLVLSRKKWVFFSQQYVSVFPSRIGSYSIVSHWLKPASIFVHIRYFCFENSSQTALKSET